MVSSGIMKRSALDRRPRLRKLSEKLTFQKSTESLVDLAKYKEKRNESSESPLCRKTGISFPEDCDQIFFINEDSGDRIHVNSEIQRIDNEFLSGYFLPCVLSNDPTRRVNHFTGKKRNVELQFQIKLKKIPKGQLYLSADLERRLKINVCQRALMKAILGNIEKRNKDFKFSLGQSEKKESSTKDMESKERNAFMRMPFESSMNSFIVTKKGQQPPSLGKELPAHYVKPEDIKYNTSDTYTFAIWSAHFDLINWKCTNLHPFQPFALSYIIGDQPISLSIQERQSNQEKNKYISFEISHSKTSSRKRGAWLSRNNTDITMANSSFYDIDDIRENPEEGFFGDSYGCVCWSPWQE